MKLFNPLIILLCLFAFAISSFAQETAAGKKFAEDFWKFLNEDRITAAEGRLASIKRREPNFDASKMEKAIADAKAKNPSGKFTHFRNYQFQNRQLF